jgi:SAM-dependent methyltransferase
MGTAASDATGALRAAMLRRFGRERLRGWLGRMGYDATHWVRVVAYRECTDWINELDPRSLDTLEIAPGHYWRTLPFKSYKTADYPAFDVCKDVLPDRFDLIIADQVFEHVHRPWAAARNVHQMLRPGGHFLCLVPFLLKVHGYPDDCTRWTENGLRHLLIDAGFGESAIRSGTWGNRSCAVANFRHGWRLYGFGRTLRREADFPVMSWALARA